MALRAYFTTATMSVSQSTHSHQQRSDDDSIIEISAQKQRLIVQSPTATGIAQQPDMTQGPQPAEAT